MSYYRDQLEAWLKTIDIKADVVYDVGGAELPIKDRVKSWDVKDRYAILDLPEWDINEPWVRFYDADIVFCLEVFEYVYNPVTAITNLSNELSSGGILYASFPFVYPWHKPIENDYLRYTRSGVLRLLKEGGFHKIEVTERMHKDQELIRKMWKADGMHVGGDAGVTGFLIKAQRR